MHLTRLCYYIILLGENIVQCVRGLGFESWSGHLGMCTLRQYSSILYRELELERFSQHVFPSRSMLVICCNPDLVLLQGGLNHGGTLYLVFCAKASKRHRPWGKCATCCGLTAQETEQGLQFALAELPCDQRHAPKVKSSQVNKNTKCYVLLDQLRSEESKYEISVLTS